MSKKNPDTAPEPGQHRTKSRQIPLQVHFSTSTLLQKILTQHCSKNPDMAIHQFLSKKILTQLWRLAKLSNCGVRIYFILKNPDIRKFRQDLDALTGTPHPGENQ